MPIIPVGFSQLTLGFTGLNQPTGGAVTLGLNQSAISTPAGVLDAIEALFTPLHEAIAVESCILSSARVKFGPDATGPFVERTYSIPGDQGTDATGPQVAILVAKVTAFGGREGRGRLYYPGATDASVDASGDLGGGYLTQLQTAFDNFYDGLDTATCIPTLLHSDPANTPDTILEFVVQTKVATQRRRVRR